MEVIVAKTAGFCFGVKRAVNMVYEELEKKEGPVYTYGPIIHNAQVVDDMKAKGVRVAEDLSEVDRFAGGTMIIRSHGVSRAEQEQMEQMGLKIVDATCPHVKKIHRIVERESLEGCHIIIIGNRSHPEVRGIMGWAHGPVTVIETPDEAREFHAPPDTICCIVSQTTFNNNKFKELVEILKQRMYNCKCMNTICNATGERQREASQIAGLVDAMLVVGGRHSSNTQKLFEICKKQCGRTFHIEVLSDLDMEELRKSSSVGITAGASTPKKIIEEVQKNVRNEF